MSLYKGHPIYGVAVPAPENQWYSRGLVYDRDLNQTIEMKRIESTARTFNTKKQAEKYGLELCKEWIDSNRP